MDSFPAKCRCLPLCIWLLVLALWRTNRCTAFVHSPLPSKSLAKQSSFLDFPSLCAKGDSDDTTEAIKSWEERWDENIAALEKYKHIYGTVNVPGTHKNGKGEFASLASFVYNARQSQGRLSKERREQLASMGFLFEGSKEEKEQQLWEETYQQLVKYKRNYSDCLVPQKWNDGVYALGRWVNKQRVKRRKGALKEERIERLNSLGFVWSVRQKKTANSPKWDKQWRIRYEELQQFYSENGHYWVKVDDNNKENPINPLARWTKHQRLMHKQGSLRPDREELLNEIDFVWDAKEKQDTQWRAKFNKLKKIVDERSTGEESGEIFIPAVLGMSLYQWTLSQRDMKLKKSLDPEREALLDRLDFDW